VGSTVDELEAVYVVPVTLTKVSVTALVLEPVLVALVAEVDDPPVVRLCEDEVAGVVGATLTVTPEVLLALAEDKPPLEFRPTLAPVSPLVLSVLPSLPPPGALLAQAARRSEPTPTTVDTSVELNEVMGNAVGREGGIVYFIMRPVSFSG
jgi:hypothetical protein